MPGELVAFNRAERVEWASGRAQDGCATWCGGRHLPGRRRVIAPGWATSPRGQALTSVEQWALSRTTKLPQMFGFDDAVAIAAETASRRPVAAGLECLTSNVFNRDSVVAVQGKRGLERRDARDGRDVLRLVKWRSGVREVGV
eukprot:6941749-Pyramimonas_sp.AAC.1